MSIIIDKLNYIYSPGTAYEKQALKNINLVIEDGEFIGLIGHTGSGKSTLIQHLNGLVKATSGGVYYNGADIYDADYNLKELRTKVGLVFQYPEHQLFETTVLKDVQFGPKNLSLTPLEVDLRAYGALKQVGIPDDLIDASPFELSGGQKRRVAIAGILAMDPDVLVLDEPAAGLDPQGAKEMMSLFVKLNREYHKTVLIVTHDMEHVLRYCDDVVVVDHGHIVQTADTATFFRDTELLHQLRINPPAVIRLREALCANGFVFYNTFAGYKSFTSLNVTNLFTIA